MDANIPDMQALFQPITFRGMTLNNRIAMSPMGLGVATDGVPSPGVIDYYSERAKGGTGLIITEATFIDHPASGDSPLLPNLYGNEALAAWRKAVALIHDAGAKTMAQLHHIGLIYDNRDVYSAAEIDLIHRPELNLLGPSGIIAPTYKQVEKPANQAQIDELIEAFGASAEVAKNIGYDGIELHGAHGYLIDQFFWDKVNVRSDRYGGDLKCRAQFAAEVVAVCRRRVGPDYPIFFRFSQFKIADFDAQVAASPQDLETLLSPLVDAGVDLFDCSQRRSWEPLFPGSPLNLAGWVKKVTGVPTQTVGSIGLDREMIASLSNGEIADVNLRSLHSLMEMFDRGDFDMVAIGRAIIAEPNFANLVRARDFDNLKAFDPTVMEELLSALTASS